MRSAAAHELMVDMRGAYRPTGLNRTWPNYLTQEGVLGARTTSGAGGSHPTHNLTLPFTRMLLGPMDYTPGGFRDVSVDAFEPAFIAPRVMGTRTHQLAMFVIYESPLQMVADSPDAYFDGDGKPAPGTDFLSMVPASWDETRVLSGAIGEHIVISATPRRRLVHRRDDQRAGAHAGGVAGIPRQERMDGDDLGGWRCADGCAANAAGAGVIGHAQACTVRKRRRGGEIVNSKTLISARDSPTARAIPPWPRRR